MASASRYSGHSGGRRDPGADAAFRRAVDELKARVPISAVVGRSVALKKAGHEWKGLCPFHSEKTPSFTVVDAAEFAHCFGCGWHGDIFKFVMDTRNIGFRAAFQALADDDLPTWTAPERTKAQAEYRLEQLKDEEAARRFFADAVPVAGTPAEVYLRARGIVAEMPGTVRFGEVPAWRDKDTGDWGPPRPALICGAQDLTGAFVGIQRIFFERDDPTLGKAWRKLSLGTCRGAALRLGPAEATVIVPEAPEDGMSIMQEGPGHPVWIGFGTSMMPLIEFPSIVRKVIIARQNNTAGRVACNKAAIAFADRGLEVAHVSPPPEFDDWNDALRARLK